ncbi:GNAT family N-acetyltransferase [Mycobacterium sp.]|uniref:GNAT family N-acetyltransferase n=1 Tax=Mycobacterium sp. TaxID=1785 RepID=UPI003D0C3FC1
MSFPAPRAATSSDAETVARLLDAFNREYHEPTPGPDVLATRLRPLLAGTDVVAFLVGDPAVAVVLLTLRPNVWYDGPIVLVDELYVVPEVRGRGIGSALLVAVASLTRERGSRLIESAVDGADTDAHRFYERHGYTATEAGQDQPSFYYRRSV